MRHWPIRCGRQLSEIVGQRHLVGEGKLLRKMIENDRLTSIVLWGPPGTGKTTLANVVAHETSSRFVPFSAVLGRVPQLRTEIAAAEEQKKFYDKKTILFVDEIHRFNKAQQDALLPHVEKGTVTLIGATTENPSFAVNSALLSRARVFELRPLSADDLASLIKRALSTREYSDLDVEPAVITSLAKLADGDARRALSVLELIHASRKENERKITIESVEEAFASRSLLYDKSGEEHYNVISAFIKSMRGSDPDAALYYMMRMLEAGEDPLFVLRRMIIFASEDIGNADPRALQIAVAADQAYQRLGMPEGMYPIAQCCTYLASTVKSNAVNKAWHAAQHDAREHGALKVPMKLRNAPTKAMKEWGYGEGYRYPHDEGGFADGETYLPDELTGRRYYEPTEAGFEGNLKARLDRLRNNKD
ncbi:MAG: replication-associated recombination protein A [Polyangiales bacterium]